MAIFNSYVSLPQGIIFPAVDARSSKMLRHVLQRRRQCLDLLQRQQLPAPRGVVHPLDGVFLGPWIPAPKWHKRQTCLQEGRKSWGEAARKSTCPNKNRILYHSSTKFLELPISINLFVIQGEIIHRGIRAANSAPFCCSTTFLTRDSPAAI